MILWYVSVLQKLNTSGLQQTIQGQPLESRRLALQLLIWLTKALVMRGHQQSKSLIMFVSLELNCSDPSLVLFQSYSMILGWEWEAFDVHLYMQLGPWYQIFVFVVFVKKFITRCLKTKFCEKKPFQLIFL